VEDDLSAFGGWVRGLEVTPVIDEASVSLVREQVRAEGERAGLPAVPVASLVNVASELAHNQLAHGRAGVVGVRTIAGREGPGLEVVAADAGPGIVDVARAIEGRGGSARGLGVGLAAVHELADEVDMDVRLDEGLCVRARKYAQTSHRGRRVGIYGRPFPGESASGDDATFVRSGGSVVVGVADGLGHGPAARQASALAMRLLADRAGAGIEQALSECDPALYGTRGAVATAARVDDLGSVAVAAVGNVGAHMYGPSGSGRFGGSSFVLGARGQVKRIASETRLLGPRDVLVLFSDGIRSSINLAAEAELLREHPVVVAQRVVERFARPDDDVLVLVVG
jgi:anti-sigma regulatory factor (Ser/Thr protein kinase)